MNRNKKEIQHVELRVANLERIVARLIRELASSPSSVDIITKRLINIDPGVAQLLDLWK